MDGVYVPGSVVDNVEYDPSTGIYVRRLGMPPNPGEPLTVSPTHGKRDLLDDLRFPTDTMNEHRESGAGTRDGLQSILEDAMGSDVNSFFPWPADPQGAVLGYTIDGSIAHESLVTPQELTPPRSTMPIPAISTGGFSTQVSSSINQATAKENTQSKRRSCLACRFESRKRKVRSSGDETAL